MTTTPPEQQAPSADAASTARRNADARATVLGWARRTVDLIPTKWLVTGAGAVLLATTAAFGGLATAPVEPVPELALGETYEGSDFEITVVGVELRTERGNAAVLLDEAKGEKVLAVTLDVVNAFAKPRPAGALAKDSPAIDGIAVAGVEGKPALSRADDGTGAGMLQPDVPVRLVAAWVVDADALRDGDAITLTLPDSTHRVGDNVLRGEDLWEDVRVGARVTATVEEVAAP